MPTITAEITQKELDAIREYANQCGITLSELVRKALIREATLADGFGADDMQYEYRMSVPDKASGRDEHKVVQDNYNKIRKILGWKEIRL